MYRRLLFGFLVFKTFWIAEGSSNTEFNNYTYDNRITCSCPNRNCLCPKIIHKNDITQVYDLNPYSILPDSTTLENNIMVGYDGPYVEPDKCQENSSFLESLLNTSKEVNDTTISEIFTENEKEHLEKTEQSPYEIEVYLNSSKKEDKESNESNESIKSILDDMLDENPTVLLSYETEGIEGLWNFLNTNNNNKNENNTLSLSNDTNPSTSSNEFDNTDDISKLKNYVSVFQISDIKEIPKVFFIVIDNMCSEKKIKLEEKEEIMNKIVDIIKIILDGNKISDINTTAFQKNSTINKMKRFIDSLYQLDSYSNSLFQSDCKNVLDILDSPRFLNFYISMLYIASDKRTARDKSDLIVKVRNKKKRLDEFFSTEKVIDAAFLGQILCSRIFEFSPPKKTLQNLIDSLPYTLFIRYKTEENFDIAELENILDNIKLMLKKMYHGLRSIKEKILSPLKRKKNPHSGILAKAIDRNLGFLIKNANTYLDDSLSYVKNEIQKLCTNEKDLVYNLYYDLGWLGLLRFENLRLTKGEEVDAKDEDIAKLHIKSYEDMFCYFDKTPFSKHSTYILKRKCKEDLIDTANNKLIREQILSLAMFYGYIKIIKGMMVCIEQNFNNLTQYIETFLESNMKMCTSENVTNITYQLRQTIKFISLANDTTQFIESTRNSITMIGNIYKMGNMLNLKIKEVSDIVETGEFSKNKHKMEFMCKLSNLIEQLKSGYTQLFDYMEKTILIHNLEK